ncbi:MAG TPA: ABC transporter substrate-binding protein [Dehalococcoidia bacterium]|nr:ABC transporter substrate-binding protein [Dehalococcoidia bacterium]
MPPANNRDYWTRLLLHRLSRRRVVTSGAAFVSGAALLAACGGSDKAPVSNGAASAKATPTPGPSPTPFFSTGPETAGLLTQIRDETATMQRGGIYKSALATPDTLDPHLPGTHVIHCWLNYGQLLKVKGGRLTRSDGTLEAELAQSWEMSPDHLTITFKLRNNAAFTPKAPLNGRPVKVDDVTFSWQRYLALSSRAAQVSAAINPDAPVASFVATDANTIVVKLAKPLATVMSLFAETVPGTFYIVPAEASDTKVLDLSATMAGSGPFYLDGYQPGKSARFRKNTGFVYDSRIVPYIDGVDFVDLPDYATTLQSFAAGEIFDTYSNFHADDVLLTKQSNGDLEVQTPGVSFANDRAFFGQAEGSPFADYRVRQALVMTWDRRVFIQTAFQTSALISSGLPVETKYDNGLRGQTYDDWWLDPQGPDFGPNIAYFKRDLNEASRMLAAVGVTTPIEYDVYYGTLARQPASFGQHMAILNGMARDSGLWKPTETQLDFDTDWAKFRTNKGAFSGMGFLYDSGENDPANDLFSHYHPAGSRSFGSDAKMAAMIEQMMVEFDLQNRIALAHEVQRYEGGMNWQPRPGGASSFRMTWPALRNKNVWRDEDQGRYLATIWLDQTKPPFV